MKVAAALRKAVQGKAVGREVQRWVYGAAVVWKAGDIEVTGKLWGS